MIGNDFPQPSDAILLSHDCPHDSDAILTRHLSRHVLKEKPAT